MSDYRQWCPDCGKPMGFGNGHVLGCIYPHRTMTQTTLPKEQKLPEIIMTSEEFEVMRAAEAYFTGTSKDTYSRVLSKVLDRVTVVPDPPKIEPKQGGTCRFRGDPDTELDILFADDNHVIFREGDGEPDWLTRSEFDKVFKVLS